MDATTTIWTAGPRPRVGAERRSARRWHHLVLDRAVALALAGAVLLSVISGVLAGHSAATTDPVPAPTPQAGWRAPSGLVVAMTAGSDRAA